MSGSEVNVILNSAEILLGAQVGIMRQIYNLKKGYNERYGANSKNAWQNHIEGALGELAVAKTLGIYYPVQVGDLGAGDIGKLEVRTTPYANGSLRLHRADKDGRVFVLVTGLNGAYKVRGWMLAKLGKDECWWGEMVKGRPAFWVPQDQLNPIHTLPVDELGIYDDR